MTGMYRVAGSADEELLLSILLSGMEMLAGKMRRDVNLYVPLPRLHGKLKYTHLDMITKKFYHFHF